jgi:uncharacterized membrane protein YjfL (UPF0719 family)
MIKMFVVFIVLTVFLMSTISVFRSLTGKEKWEVVKVASYAAAVSVVSVLLLVGFVIIF